MFLFHHTYTITTHPVMLDGYLHWPHMCTNFL